MPTYTRQKDWARARYTSFAWDPATQVSWEGRESESAVVLLGPPLRQYHLETVKGRERMSTLRLTRSNTRLGESRTAEEREAAASRAKQHSRIIWLLIVLVCFSFLRLHFRLLQTLQYNDDCTTTLLTAGTNISLTARLWSRLHFRAFAVEAQAARRFSQAASSQRVESTSATATGRLPHTRPSHTAQSIRGPWPFIKINMSASEDDKPLVKGTYARNQFSHGAWKVVGFLAKSDSSLSGDLVKILLSPYITQLQLRFYLATQSLACAAHAFEVI